MLFRSIWIKFDSKGTIIFRQERVGLNGVIFKIHKFRTMRIGSEKGQKLTVGEDKRITRSGTVLRRYKIDELPQLLDVLLGKMSVVGPRPEIEKYMEYYPKATRDKILSIKPGITDLASIEMIDENHLLAEYSEPEKAYVKYILPMKQKYYLKYVDNNSLTGDFIIILRTLFRILK